MASASGAAATVSRTRWKEEAVEEVEVAVAGAEGKGEVVNDGKARERTAARVESSARIVGGEGHWRAGAGRCRCCAKGAAAVGAVTASAVAL